ncbi:MAG: radical SAM protein [Victivallaceae bacterium]|nr:radical SAM protein [Victivallaceae bacterium]
MPETRKCCVFGPIPSRRLGTSLGVDLVAPKTCSMDCIYCEAGATTDLSLERRTFVPFEKAVADLEAVLSKEPKLDFITYSGFGEPTLSAELGPVTAWIKRTHPEYRVCLLTNGLLLGDPEVRKAANLADLVIPSCDGSNDFEFKRINRPAAGISFDEYIDGLVEFSTTATTRVELEIFIVPGINDSDESISRFADIVRRMKPAAVQLNSLDRPGVERGIVPASAQCMRRFITAIEPVTPVQAVGNFRYFSRPSEPIEPDEETRRILDVISRRPATAADVAQMLGTTESDAEILLEKVLRSGEACCEKLPRGTFYSAIARS